jgi:hypothetical protein
VTLDVDTSARNALYIARTRFRVDQTEQGSTGILDDPGVLSRITAGLSPYVEGGETWKIQYTITGSGDGSPITGIPLIDPVTGAVLASNPSVATGGRGAKIRRSQPHIDHRPSNRSNSHLPARRLTTGVSRGRLRSAATRRPA